MNSMYRISRDQIVGEQLHRRHRPDAARIKRRGMHVSAFHQAKHLARVAADLKVSR